MSEEEKKAIEHTERFCYGKQLWEEDLECIKTLLNLIEKYKVELIETKEANRQLSIEIEQLEKENEELKADIDKTIEEGREAILFYTKDSIPKSVIREKLDKLKREFDFYAGREHAEWQDGEFDGEVCDDLALQIKALKGLLEAKDE